MGRSKLTGVRDQISATKTKIKKLDGRIAQIDKLEKEFEAKEKEAEANEKSLPDTDEIDALLKQIEQSASESMLSLVSFEKERQRSTRGKGAAVQQYETFKYGLEFTGKYENFVEFVHRMEYKMSRHFALMSFSVTGDSDGLEPGTNQHQFKMEFVTYAFKKTAARTVKKKGK